MQVTRVTHHSAVLLLVLIGCACNSVLGIDAVAALPPDASPHPDAPPPPMCDVAENLSLVVANPATSLLRQCSNGVGACLSLLLNADSKPDVLSMQLYDKVAGHGILNAPGTYSLGLPDAKLDTCGICVAISADFDSSNSKYSQTYVASAQGTLKLTQVDGNGMAGKLQNLKLRHVNIADGSTTDANDSCMTTIDDVEFTATYSGAGCTPACDAGDVCASDDGHQVCCPGGFPYWCRGLGVCFSNVADRNAACANAYYGDPAAGCKAGQTPASLVGASGSYCAPSCSGTGSTCPNTYNGKMGSCVLKLGGSAVPNACILGCTHVGAQGGECLPGMTCQQASNGGAYCLY